MTLGIGTLVPSSNRWGTLQTVIDSLVGPQTDHAPQDTDEVSLGSPHRAPLIGILHSRPLASQRLVQMQGRDDVLALQIPEAAPLEAT